MTRREWLIDVVSKIPDADEIRVWAIMSEDDDSLTMAIGEDAKGSQMMILTANLLKHVAKFFKTTPEKAAIASMAYYKMKEALKKAGVAEDEAEDEADDEE